MSLRTLSQNKLSSQVYNKRQVQPTPYGSVSFDGSGDYITIDDNAAMELGGSDYTIEMWLKTTTSALYTTFFGRDNNNFTGNGDLILALNWGSANGSAVWYAKYGAVNAIITSSSSLRNGSWHHLAVVRYGNTHTIYIDGTSAATGTFTGSLDDGTGPWAIGTDLYNPGRDFAGNISNLRVVKSAVYTSNFTPPSSPLTAIANTALLTCQLSTTTTTDNSGNGLTLTAYGNVTASSDSPFA